MNITYNPYQFHATVLDQSALTYVGAMAYADYLDKRRNQLEDALNMITNGNLQPTGAVGVTIEGRSYFAYLSTIAGCYNDLMSGVDVPQVGLYGPNGAVSRTDLSNVIVAITGQIQTDRIMSSVSRYLATASDVIKPADIKTIVETASYDTVDGEMLKSLTATLSNLQPSEALSVLFSTADHYSATEESAFVDYSNYGDDAWSLASAIFNGIFTEVATAFREAIDKINTWLDIFSAIGDAITAVGEKLIKVLFSDLVNDFEQNANAVWPGCDFPIFQAKWDSTNDFLAWFQSAMIEFGGKYMTSLNSLDDADFNQLTDYTSFPNFSTWLNPSCRWDTSDFDSEDIETLNSILMEKRVITMFVGGCVISVWVESNGSVLCQVRLSGYTYGASNFTLVTGSTAFSGGSYGASLVERAVSPSDVYRSLFCDNNSYKLLMSTPIFHNGHLYKFTESDDFYSRMNGANQNSQDFANWVAENNNLSLTSSFTDNWDGDHDVEHSYMFLQTLIAYALYAVTLAKTDRPLPLIGFNYTTAAGHNVRATLSRGSQVPSTTFIPWFPYATCGPGASRFHFQTNTERSAEIKTALLNAAVAAAVVAGAVTTVKLKKSLKRNVTVNRARVSQLTSSVDINDPNSVKELMRAQRSYNITSALNELLNGRSMSSAVSSLFNEAPSGEPDYAILSMIFKSISGRVPQS